MADAIEIAGFTARYYKYHRFHCGGTFVFNVHHHRKKRTYQCGDDKKCIDEFMFHVDFSISKVKT